MKIKLPNYYVSPLLAPVQPKLSSDAAPYDTTEVHTRTAHKSNFEIYLYFLIVQFLFIPFLLHMDVDCSFGRIAEGMGDAAIIGAEVDVVVCISSHMFLNEIG